jgi:hypothetical protein
MKNHRPNASPARYAIAGRLGIWGRMIPERFGVRYDKYSFEVRADEFIFHTARK